MIRTEFSMRHLGPDQILLPVSIEQAAIPIVAEWLQCEMEQYPLESQPFQDLRDLSRVIVDESSLECHLELLKLGLSGSLQLHALFQQVVLTRFGRCFHYPREGHNARESAHDRPEMVPKVIGRVCGHKSVRHNDGCVLTQILRTEDRGEQIIESATIIHYSTDPGFADYDAPFVVDLSVHRLEGLLGPVGILHAGRCEPRGYPLNALLANRSNNTRSGTELDRGEVVFQKGYNALDVNVL